MEVRIARIDTCDVPSHVIGYTILHKPTKKTLYLDAFVPIDSCTQQDTETMIVKKGWDMVKSSADQWIAELEKQQHSLIGTVFDPVADA